MQDYTDNAAAQPQQRNAVMDVLRIVAMLFIIAHHLVINNIGLTEIQSGILPESRVQYYINGFIDCFIIIGVNLFFLLSGYFGLRLKKGRIFPLVFKVYIYWVLSALIGLAAGIITFNSVWDGILACLGAIGKYWFVLAYIAVFLLSPLLNSLAESLNGAMLKYFVFISVLLFCIIGYAGDYVFPILGTNNGYSPIWACIVYTYGRLIRLHGNKLKDGKALWFTLYAVFCAVNFAVFGLFLGVFENGKLAWHVFGYNNPLVFGASLFFFTGFTKINRNPEGKTARAVSRVAGHTFAIYLLHSGNPLLPRWRAFLIDLCGSRLYLKYIALLPNVLIIFAVGALIDAIYCLLLEKPVYRLSVLIESGICFLYGKLQRLITKIFKRENA